MATRCIYDYSVLMYMNWLTMFSANYKHKTKKDSELLEYSHNMLMMCLEYQHRFDPIETVIAMDGFENWRLGAYNSYYHDAVDYWKELDKEDSWVVLVDGVYKIVRRNQATLEWYSDKPSAETKKTLVPSLEDRDLWIPFLEGNTPKDLLDEYPDLPKHVKDTTAWEGLTLVVPRYKGSRSKTNWTAKTPKDVWKKYSRNLAYNLAPMVGAREVLVERAEADDVIAIYVEKMAEEHPEDRIVLVTKDRDLDQLLLKNPRLEILNLQYNDWIDDTRDLTILKLVLKLIGGDSSDDINGCLVKGSPTKAELKTGTREAGASAEYGTKVKPRLTPLPTVSWEESTKTVKNGTTTSKWLRAITDMVDNDWGKVFDVLDEVLEQGTWEKNLTMVHLDNIPEDIKDEIREVLSDVNPRDTDEFKFEDAEVTPADQMICKSKGLTLRALDSGESTPDED